MSIKKTENYFGISQEKTKKINKDKQLLHGMTKAFMKISGKKIIRLLNEQNKSSGKSAKDSIQIV